MLSAMAQNPIARRLAAFVVVLTLVVGGAPVAMAAPGMAECGMAMGSMNMQPSMSQDQHSMAMTMSMPMQKHQVPCKDMSGLCAATCGSAINLPYIAYSPALASKPVVPEWALQTALASVLTRPDIPPPIATL